MVVYTIKRKLKVIWDMLTREVTVCYSRDGSLYYLEGYACPHCYWFSVKMCTEKPDDDCSSYDGGKYYRRCLPFIFWKVKSGESKRISINDQLIQDYVTCSSGWHGDKNEKNKK